MSEELDLFDQEDSGKYLIGTVNAVYFEASDSFYKVLQVLIKETNFDWDDQRITVTGSFVEFDTFACVIDLEHGTLLKDYTEGDSIKFWEKFFRDDDVELVDEYKAVRETEEDSAD